jgi:outer membrane protein assembly factor BamE (lipoprotein component of BamABCDE complex)
VRSIHSGRYAKLLALGVMLAPLAACSMPDFLSMPAFLSYPPQVRGDRIDPDQIKQLVPGTSTRADVTALVGSPTAKATFDDNTWIYISEVTKPQIGGTQSVLDQQVYLMTFDSRGVLTAIQKKTMDDRKSVAMVSRTTPSPGTEASVIQQLLGNVGRFGAGSLPGTPAGAQGSSTNPGNF